MAVVQRALLNTTGPLCSLHETLSSENQVPPEEIKCIVDKTLWLLGSTNHQLSLLRSKKVLANINKENHSQTPNVFCLGRTPSLLLPNKQNFLVAWLRTCQMHRSPKWCFQKSGITKNWQRPKTTDNFSKHQTNWPKNYRSSRPNKGFSNQDSTTT